jgi:hypothetical protein
MSTTYRDRTLITVIALMCGQRPREYTNYRYPSMHDYRSTGQCLAPECACPHVTVRLFTLARMQSEQRSNLPKNVVG